MKENQKDTLEHSEKKCVTVIKKICMLGDPAVGKTSLVSRYVYSMFDDNYLTTIGAKVSKKSILIKHPRYDFDVDLKLMVWDIAGQQTFDWVKPLYFLNSAGAPIICDLTNKKSFESLEKWINALFKANGKIPIVFIANKADCKFWEFDPVELEEFAKKYNSPFFVTSAKFGDNVEEAFNCLSKLVVEKIEKKI